MFYMHEAAPTQSLRTPGAFAGSLEHLEEWLGLTGSRSRLSLLIVAFDHIRLNHEASPDITVKNYAQ